MVVDDLDTQHDGSKYTNVGLTSLLWRARPTKQTNNPPTIAYHRDKQSPPFTSGNRRKENTITIW